MPLPRQPTSLPVARSKYHESNTTNAMNAMTGLAKTGGRKAMASAETTTPATLLPMARLRKRLALPTGSRFRQPLSATLPTPSLLQDRLEAPQSASADVRETEAPDIAAGSRSGWNARYQR